MPDLNQALIDFVATSNSGKYNTEEELMSKFPELKGYDSQLLIDFVATSNSGKYNTEEELMSKFPEFNVKKKEETLSKGSEAPAEVSLENGEADGLMNLIADGDKKRKEASMGDTLEDKAISDWEVFQTAQKELNPEVEEEAFDPTDLTSIPALPTDNLSPGVSEEVKNQILSRNLNKYADSSYEYKQGFKNKFLKENPEVEKEMQSADPEVAKAADLKLSKAFKSKTKLPFTINEGDKEISEFDKMINAFRKGMDDHTFNSIMAYEFATADDDEAKIILENMYQEQIRQSEDIRTDFTDAPELLSLEGLAGMAGGQLALIAGTMAISATLTPAAGLAYAITDGAYTSYAAEFMGAYQEARALGKSEEESYAIGLKQSKVSFVTGGIEAGVGVGTAKIATKIGTATANKFGKKLLAPLIEKAATGVADLGLDAFMAGTGALINNSTAIAQGLNRGYFDGVPDAMVGEIMFSGIMKSKGTFKTVADFKKYVNGLPPKDQQKIFNDFLDNKKDVESKVVLDQTNGYLNLKKLENPELAAEIEANPIDNLLKERTRLETIVESISDKRAIEETNKNIEALDIMMGSLDAIVVDGKSMDPVSLKNKLEDPEFVKGVVDGDVNIEINNHEGLQKALTYKVDDFRKNEVENLAEQEYSEVAKTYKDRLTKLKKENPEDYWSVDMPEDAVIEEAAKNGRIVDVNGGMGIVTKDGDLLGLFKYDQSKSGVAKAVQGERVKMGGVKTDNFDGPLTKNYEKNGFRVVSRTPFNEDYAPEGWNKEKHGTPDIVAMVYDPEGKMDIEEKTFLDPETGYDSAIDYRNSVLDQKADVKKEGKWDEWTENPEGWEGNEVFNSSKGTSDVEYKGETMPENDVKKSIKAYRSDIEMGMTKDEAANSGLETMQDTEWYQNLSDDKKTAFDVDFKKSLGVKDVVDPLKTAEINKQVKAIDAEIKARKDGSDKNAEFEKFNDKDLTDKKTELKERVTEIKEANPFVKKKARTILKDKIKNMAKGAKEGAKAAKGELKTVQKELIEYSRAVLGELNVTNAVRNQMETAIVNSTRANIDKRIAKVDEIAERYIKKRRVKTIASIIDLVTNPKKLLKKKGGNKGGRSVAKVPSDIKNFIENFDTESLKSMSADEVAKVYEGLTYIVKGGQTKRLAIERAEKSKKRKAEAKSFLTFHKISSLKADEIKQDIKNINKELKNRESGRGERNSEFTSLKDKDLIKELDVLKRKQKENFDTEVSGLEAINTELNDGNKTVAIIDGQMFSSESGLKNFLKHNDGADLNNVKIYITKNTPEVKSSKSKNKNSVKNISKRVLDFLNPIKNSANLKNNLSFLAKDSKEGRLLVEEIYEEVSISELDLDDFSNAIKRDLEMTAAEIFEKKSSNRWSRAASKVVSKADRMAKVRVRLAKEGLSKEDSKAILEAIDSDITLSNDVLINWYNAAKTEKGRKQLKEVQKVNLDIVDMYMNKSENADLKAFADYLVDDFYKNLRDRYDPTFFKLTGLHFDEGVYYPLHRVVPSKDVTNIQTLVDGDGKTNILKPLAGSLKQTVNNSASIDLTRGAFGVAENYVNTMERSKQFIPVGERINEIFNKNTVPEIVNKIGEDNYVNIEDHLITAITGRSPRKGSNLDNKWMNGLMGIKIFASLAGKFSSVPKQLTSAARYTSAEDVSIYELAQTLKKIPTKLERELMMEIIKSEYVVNRFKGAGFDLETSRIAKMEGSMSVEGILKGVTKAGMMPISVGDIGGVLLGGVPYSLAIYRQGIKKGMNHEKAKKYAYDKFRMTSKSTQQSSKDSEVSHMQRSDVGRIFSMYTTSQKQGMNKMIYSARMLGSNSGLTATEKIRHAYNVLFYSGENMLFASVANGFIKTVYEYLSGDKNEEEFIKGMYDTAMDSNQSLISGLGYNGVLLNYIVSLTRGDEWKNELPLSQELEVLSKAANVIMTNYMQGKNPKDMTDSEIKVLMKSIPMNGFLKTIKDFEKASKGEKTFTESVMGWKSDSEKKGFKPKHDMFYEYLFSKPYTTLTEKQKFDKYKREKSAPMVAAKKKLKDGMK